MLILRRFFIQVFNAEAVYDKLSIEVRMTVGDKLDGGVADGLNEGFENQDLPIEVTEAFATGIYISMVTREDAGILSARGVPHRRQETSAILQLRLASAGISGRVVSTGRNGSCVDRYMA